MKPITLIAGISALFFICVNIDAQLAHLYQNALVEISHSVKLPEPDLFKNRIVPVFMIVMGIGMAGIWIADIASGKFSGRGNLFKWREGENMMWPHIIAEYLTATGLIIGGAGLYYSKEWALEVSLLSLGAVIYSAINSSGWVLGDKSRTAYGIPIWFSLAGSVVSCIILLI